MKNTPSPWRTPQQIQSHYPPTYRAAEIARIARWVAGCHSGCVAGLPGTGRATLLKFLCQNPHLLTETLNLPPGSIALIPIDLSILPDKSLATFYRVVLRTFYQVRQHFKPDLATAATDLYRQSQASQDAFLPQSDLLELLTRFGQHGVRVVWVLNRFDLYYHKAPAELADTLRSLRDSFKGGLCYLISMHQDLPYFSNQAMLGVLYHIIDTRICWIGPLSEADAHHDFKGRLKLADPPPTETDIHHLTQLTGGFPALTPLACHWWQKTGRNLPTATWQAIFIKQPNVQYRLEELWDSLTQTEQFALHELQLAHTRYQQAIATDKPAKRKQANQNRQQIETRHYDTLTNLVLKGVCYLDNSHYYPFSPLFRQFIQIIQVQARGKVWFNSETKVFSQGRTRLTDLTPLEQAILTFFTTFPHERHTYTQIIENAWPDEEYKEGVSTETLQQHIRALRRKIEATPGTPAYVVNWRGQPEGGYQFFPEGRPRERMEAKPLL